MTSDKYQRACDASAASRILGTSCFVAASDEDYILRIYDSTAPGLPVHELDVIDFLAPLDPGKEPDIEGSAQIGDRIYWIGSHGRDKNAHEQESRQRLFATKVTIATGQPALEPLGTPYKQLLRDLFSASELNEFGLRDAAALAPEKPGGLNIEGLTNTPEGHLFLGFRNPIPHGKALLVRLLNPADVVAGSGPANVTKGGLLDLGGRGIRAVEPLHDGRYYVLAGAFDDTKDFALFMWDSVSGATTLILDGAALNDLGPEELLITSETAAGRAVQFLSDDGDALVTGVKCKDVKPAERSFRASTIQLP